MLQVWMKRLPMLIEVLLVLLLAWLVTGWTLPDNGAEMTHSEMLPVNEGRDALDVELILNVPLFGEPGKVKPIAPNRSYKDVSSSRFKIQLLGTAVAGKKSAAVVMMQGSKDQKVLFLGDSVQPGVILEKVMAEEIILNRNGELERVVLQKDGHQAVASPSPTAVSPNRSKMHDYRFSKSQR